MDSDLKSSASKDILSPCGVYAAFRRKMLYSHVALACEDILSPAYGQFLEIAYVCPLVCDKARATHLQEHPRIKVLAQVVCSCIIIRDSRRSLSKQGGSE
jgi:hypothetical protein